MWIGLAIVFALMVALRVAAIRSALFWLLGLLLGPILTLRVRSGNPADDCYKPVSREQSARELRIPQPVITEFSAVAHEFAALGFIEQGTLATFEADGTPKHLICVLVHESQTTAALLSRSTRPLASEPVGAAIFTMLSSGKMTSYYTVGPDAGLGVHQREWCFPTLRDPALLLRAHHAVLRHHAKEQPAPLPAQPLMDMFAWSRRSLEDTSPNTHPNTRPNTHLAPVPCEIPNHTHHRRSQQHHRHHQPTPKAKQHHRRYECGRHFTN